jgi:hypothetical protein
MKKKSQSINKMMEALKDNPRLLMELDKNILKIFAAANINPTTDDKADFLKELAKAKLPLEKKDTY